MTLEEVKCKSLVCVHCVPVHRMRAGDLGEEENLLVVLVHLTNNFDRRMMKLKAY